MADAGNPGYARAHHPVLILSASVKISAVIIMLLGRESRSTSTCAAMLARAMQGMRNHLREYISVLMVGIESACWPTRSSLVAARAKTASWWLCGPSNCV